MSKKSNTSGERIREAMRGAERRMIARALTWRKEFELREDQARAERERREEARLIVEAEAAAEARRRKGPHTAETVHDSTTGLQTPKKAV